MIKVDCEKEGFQKIADAAFRRLNLQGEARIEVELVDEAEIRALNLRARGIDKATDVLSFPMLEKIDIFDEKHYPYSYDEASGAVELGSVVICKEIAEAQGAAYGHGAEREYSFLFLHGLLHVLGYDHMTEEEERTMNTVADTILNGLGITRI